MKCVHCQHKMTFLESLKIAWKPASNHEVICPHCHKFQYISNRNLWKSYGVMLVIEAILMLCAPLFNISIPTLIILTILALAAITIIFPMTLKLVKEKDGLLEEQFREMERNKRLNK